MNEPKDLLAGKLKEEDMKFLSYLNQELESKAKLFEGIKPEEVKYSEAVEKEIPNLRIESEKERGIKNKLIEMECYLQIGYLTSIPLGSKVYLQRLIESYKQILSYLK